MKSGHESETTRAGHNVRRVASVQFSAPHVDIRFEKLQLSPFRRGPLNTLSDVELITADYVAWYNQQRLMHRLGRVPPAEAEADYYAQHVTDRPAGSQNPEGA